MVSLHWQNFLKALRGRLRRFEHSRTPESSSFRFVVTIAPDELDGGFIASIDDMPGCLSQGETVDEAIENVLEALNEIFIDTLSEQADTKDENSEPFTRRAGSGGRWLALSAPDSPLRIGVLAESEAAARALYHKRAARWLLPDEESEPVSPRSEDDR